MRLPVVRRETSTGKVFARQPDESRPRIPGSILRVAFRVSGPTLAVLSKNDPLIPGFREKPSEGCSPSFTELCTGSWGASATGRNQTKIDAPMARSLRIDRPDGIVTVWTVGAGVTGASYEHSASRQFAG